MLSTPQRRYRRLNELHPALGNYSKPSWCSYFPRFAGSVYGEVNRRQRPYCAVQLALAQVRTAGSNFTRIGLLIPDWMIVMEGYLLRLCLGER